LAHLPWYLSRSAPTSTTPLHEELRYIVFESCLLQLFRQCITCQAPCSISTKTEGTPLILTAVCPFEHSRTWHSQPLIHDKGAGNLLLCAGIAFTGSSPVKVLRLLRLINIKPVAERTYFLYQNCFLLPAIERVWSREQESLLAERRGKRVCLAGDGRFDSPGHSAKYMTYTFMEMRTSKVVYFVQVQLGEAIKTSNAMELYGCMKGLTFLKGEGVMVEALTTDRHASIKGHMKKKEPNTLHYFDTLHIAKGISKKVQAASKYTGCGVLASWAQPASNHIYWCAANSEDDGKLLVEMWKSINNHVLDKHTDHGALYNRCVHDTVLGDREWLSPGTPAHRRFVAITTQPMLLKDLEQVSPEGQTYNLESYHSLLIKFAPKSVAFTPKMMFARTRLAALHQNENSARRQATTKKGHPMWKRTMVKARKGTEVVRTVTTGPNYAYVGRLLAEAIACCNEWTSFKEALNENPQEEPLPMVMLYPRLPKEQLVARRMSRFCRGAAGPS
ncbi:unnamed protein product, partial [Ixodes hexagonus]